MNVDQQVGSSLTIQRYFHSLQCISWTLLSMKASSVLGIYISILWGMYEILAARSMLYAIQIWNYVLFKTIWNYVAFFTFSSIGLECENSDCSEPENWKIEPYANLYLYWRHNAQMVYDNYHEFIVIYSSIRLFLINDSWNEKPHLLIN